MKTSRKSLLAVGFIVGSGFLLSLVPLAFRTPEEKRTAGIAAANVEAANRRAAGIASQPGRVAAIAAEQKKSVPVPIPTVDKSEDKQAKRLEYINKCIKNGYFKEVGIEQYSSLRVRVVVTPLFLIQDFDAKEYACGVIWRYYFDGSEQAATVRLYESINNRQVGIYESDWGQMKLNMK